MTIRFCQHCGASQLEGAVFCEHCGERLIPLEPPPSLAEIASRVQTRELPPQQHRTTTSDKLRRFPYWIIAVIIGLIGIGCISLIALAIFLISFSFSF